VGRWRGGATFGCWWFSLSCGLGRTVFPLQDMITVDMIRLTLIMAMVLTTQVGSLSLSFTRLYRIYIYVGRLSARSSHVAIGITIQVDSASLSRSRLYRITINVDTLMHVRI
jgi:hypothetical protein